jgi:hypothetical protein
MIELKNIGPPILTGKDIIDQVKAAIAVAEQIRYDIILTAGSYQMPMSISDRDPPLEAASIKVDHQLGMKVETPFKDQVTTVKDILTITMPGDLPKDQIGILICEGLIEAQICSNL